ncbi:hypothetical protein [Micromonospora inositola]|uniref:Uncharacterized protein n=1 Tax=Micromonospora inositola TaxID=47865 RepID=A0A1C5K421_9ACTN|nr:hypothetical protein [Micromonospora inositola]SCG77341.1 hypothetical protein GA0070613_6232 [Micromonospora inositola]
MLDHVFLRDAFDDFGTTAEALLIYPRVTLVINETSIDTLGRVTHPESWIEFFEQNAATVTLARIVQSGTVSFSASVSARGSDSGTHLVIDDEDTESFELAFKPYWYQLANDDLLPYRGQLVRGYSRRLIRLARKYRGSLELYDTLLSDQEALRSTVISANVLIGAQVGSGNLDFSDYRVRVTEEGLRYHRLEESPGRRFVGAASVAGVAAELPMWAASATEARVGMNDAMTIQALVSRSLSNATLKNGREADAFVESVVGVPSISQLFNNLSEEEQWPTFVKLFEDGRRFRAWVGSLSPDTQLLQEYLRSLSSNRILERLPAKTARWAFFTGSGLALDILGAGGLGTATGVGLSIFDGFFLDRIAHGWRPGSYIADLKETLSQARMA